LARGQLVVMLDDDMEPSPRLLASHMAGHAAEDRMALVGAAPIVLGPSPSPVLRYVADKFNGNLERLTDTAKPVTHRDFYSGNFSCRRDLLLAVGAFDEDFRVYGHEDGDLALRLVAAGARLAYSPEALAYQRYTKDFAGLANDNLHKGQTAVLLARKHPQAVADLKLSRYREASVRWRVLRLAMLHLSDIFTGVPDLVIAVTAALERLVPDRLQRYYFFALDYFYWLGARAGGHLLQR
jgi:GT2 family glycosyltransferase